jgi:hypothetical protein
MRHFPKWRNEHNTVCLSITQEVRLEGPPADLAAARRCARLIARVMGRDLAGCVLASLGRYAEFWEALDTAPGGAEALAGGCG